MKMKAKIFFDKGVYLYTEKRYVESLNMFEKAIEFQPLYIEAYNNKGLALDQLKKHEEALKIFDKALEINPKSASAHNNKGSVFHALRRYDEAIFCFEKALEIDSNYDAAKINREASNIYKRVSTIAMIIYYGHIKLQDKIKIYLIDKPLEEQIRFSEAMVIYEKALELRSKHPIQFADENSKDMSFEMIEANILLKEIERLRKEERKLKKQKKAKDKNLNNEEEVKHNSNLNLSENKKQINNNYNTKETNHKQTIITENLNTNNQTLKSNKNKCSEKNSNNNEGKCNDFIDDKKVEVNSSNKKQDMTLDEVINFINDENEDKKTIKKSKKKKKNKTIEINEKHSNEKIYSNKNRNNCLENKNNKGTYHKNRLDDSFSLESFLDDFVESFKKSLNQNSMHAESCIKIKPTFTKTWLDNLAD